MTEQKPRRTRWYWADIDRGKIDLFARLLSEAFPDHQATNGPDLYPDCWLFRIETGPRVEQQRAVIVMREFFENNDWAAIQRKFHDWRLAKAIAGRASVLVTEVGPDVVTPEGD